jgi:hypothetical protein
VAQRLCTDEPAVDYLWPAHPFKQHPIDLPVDALLVVLDRADDLVHVEIIRSWQRSTKSDGLAQRLQVSGIEETEIVREFSGN